MRQPEAGTPSFFTNRPLTTSHQHPTSELWLLRHGATTWARQGRHTGTTDLALLPDGEDEARALASVLSPLSFAAVLCSPLLRARQTCELAGLAGAALPCEDLREWDYGDYEGITTAEIRQQIPGWSAWSHGCPGGESVAQVDQRCQRVIALALALVPAPGQRVALFAHGHILRALGVAGWAWGPPAAACCRWPPVRSACSVTNGNNG